MLDVIGAIHPSCDPDVLLLAAGLKCFEMFLQFLVAFMRLLHGKL